MAHSVPAKYDEINALCERDSQLVEARRDGEQSPYLQKPAVEKSTAEKGGQSYGDFPRRK